MNDDQPGCSGTSKHAGAKRDEDFAYFRLLQFLVLEIENPIFLLDHKKCRENVALYVHCITQFWCGRMYAPRTTRTRAHTNKRMSV